MRKWKYTPHSVHHLYVLSYHQKNLHPRIYFRLNKIVIDNKYDLYSIAFADISSTIERVDFTVSYAPVAVIRYLIIIVAIDSAKGLITFTCTYPTLSKILFYPILNKGCILVYHISTWNCSKLNGQNIH